MTEGTQQVALALTQKADALVINSKETFDAGHALYISFREAEKKIEEHYKEPISQAHSKHKRLVDLKKRHIAEFSKGKMSLKKKLDVFTREQEKAAAIERAKQAEKAKKEAEERQLAMAKEAQEKGENDLADAILEAPVTPEITAPPPEIQKRKGARENWTARIVDAKALCAAYGNGIVTLPALDDKQLAQITTALGLKKMAGSLKGNMNFPGVEVIKETV